MFLLVPGGQEPLGLAEGGAVWTGEPVQALYCHKQPPAGRDEEAQSPSPPGNTVHPMPQDAHDAREQEKG